MRRATASSVATCSGRVRQRSYRGWRSRSNVARPSGSSTRPSASTRVPPRNSSRCATNTSGRRRRPQLNRNVSQAHLRIIELWHMPDALDASRYEVPLAALIDAIESTEAARKWDKLHSAQERAVTALESRRAELNTLYERAVAPDTGWQEITQAAAMIGELQRAAAEKPYPQIDALQRKLAAPGNDMPPEVRRARQEASK